MATKTKTHKLATGTIEAAVKQVATSYTMFDIIDLLDETMAEQPALHSRVLESMCWMIDSSCISQARTVLFERWKDIDPEEVTDFDGFCQDIGEELSRSSHFDFDGDEKTLATLLALRTQWHDDAYAAAGADDRDYKSKSLREQMEQEKAQKPNVGTRANYRKMAQLEAAGRSTLTDGLMNTLVKARGALDKAAKALDNLPDEHDPIYTGDNAALIYADEFSNLNAAWVSAKAKVEQAELEYNTTIENKEQRFYDAYMEADTAASTQRIESNKRLMPTILEILRAASKHAPASAKFNDLPEVKQKQLTTFAVGVIERCKVDVAKKYARQPIAFAHIAEAAYLCTQKLNDVIRVKYNSSCELELVRTQGSIEHERGQKRKACSID